MTDKAYIVANKEQELYVLNKFEEEGLIWFTGEKPTEWLPSQKIFNIYDVRFPYALAVNNENEYESGVFWFRLRALADEEIVYDGRKEEKTSKKYFVTQEFMDELIKWRNHYVLDATLGGPLDFVDGNNINEFPDIVDNWWGYPDNPIERNNRLIAIIQWLNGEDVFEVEKTHKFIVRSENTNADKYYTYVEVDEGITTTVYSVKYATNFYTREEAQEWANSHQVVVEIDEEGNEVE